MTSLAAKRIVVASVALALTGLSAPAFAAEDGSWKDGADVYAKICGYCHDTGVGPGIKGRQLPPEYTGLIVRQGLGAMPAFRSSVIDDKALQALAEYISKSPAAGAKP
ncbi:P-cresol methylhydroxylase cytochrome subunit [Methylocaldum marinum]|uniref:p-cresol methylhydroxylase cytochrome subunit n=1 Tax=Methylocaldum marinum TaxID=1432792 RepID=A0A250KLU7_9GAMM|nr:cytochrome c [Methylocaldum marinum]BBA32544.1 P-cresol methylhydroxylase cytochrome subunit [Methylocaldum marinum]